MFRFQSSEFFANIFKSAHRNNHDCPNNRMQVRSALGTFQENLVGPCYFFMCFFANNQYRILVEESSSGSDNLEEVFETNLKRIGRMVAILDTWDQPTYLTRVWTVYEQFVASTIQIEATVGICWNHPPVFRNSDHLQLFGRQMKIDEGSIVMRVLRYLNCF